MFAVSFATSVFAHELEPDQVLFSRDFSGERIETSHFSVTMKILGGDDPPRYSILLRSRETGRNALHLFEQGGGPEPHLDAYNRAYYCDQSVVFITVQYPIPPMADIRQHRFETHAFLGQTLEYLDTAYASLENIAPHEVGVDLGWPYITPQRYLVVCAQDGDAPAIRFHLNEEAEN